MRSSRGAFLGRVGVVAGAAVIGAPAAAADTAADLANVRLVAAGKRLSIAWYTAWLDRRPPDRSTAALVRRIRRHEERHLTLLAPLLGDTAPAADDYTFAFPATALRDRDGAVAFSAELEALLRSIGITAAASTADTGVAEALGRVASSDAAHLAVLGGLRGDGLGVALPRPLPVAEASIELDRYLR